MVSVSYPGQHRFVRGSICHKMTHSLISGGLVYFQYLSIILAAVVTVAITTENSSFDILFTCNLYPSKRILWDTGSILPNQSLICLRILLQKG